MADADVCYLSIVAASRNDDHGGRLLERMQCFVDGVCGQLLSRSTKVELILVEWNPPANRRRLVEALAWTGARTGRVRVVEVPESIHCRFRYSESLPFFQMIAKNAGIRRAKGRYVLCTNIDILFSDALCNFLLSCRLNPRSMYRMDRYDVSSGWIAQCPPDERLSRCHDHTIRVCCRNGTQDQKSGHVHTIYPDATWRGRIHEVLQDVGLKAAVTRKRLHTNGCGDFTLMSKENWMSLRGYPETEMYSFHLDSVLCHRAVAKGVRERLLRSPMKIFHLEHDVGSGWTPEGQGSLDSRLNDAGVPRMSDLEFERLAVQIRGDGDVFLNPVSWGLSNDSLRETLV